MVKLEHLSFEVQKQLVSQVFGDLQPVIRGKVEQISIMDHMVSLLILSWELVNSLHLMFHMNLQLGLKVNFIVSTS